MAHSQQPRSDSSSRSSLTQVRSVGGFGVKSKMSWVLADEDVIHTTEVGGYRAAARQLDLDITYYDLIGTG